MGMWAARDENGDLGIHDGRPTRRDDGIWTVAFDKEQFEADFYWTGSFGPDPLPELTWEKEAIPVEVVIKRRDL